MRLAIFTDSSVHFCDGVARILQEMIAYVSQHQEHSMLLFHRNGHKPDSKDLMREDYSKNVVVYGNSNPCLRVPGYGAYPWFYVKNPKRQLLKKTKEFNPDVLITISPYVARGIARSASYVAKKIRRPLIGSFDLHLVWNTEYYIRALFRLPLLRKTVRWFAGIQMNIYNQCARILVPSIAIKKHVESHYPGIDTVMFVRAVDSEDFSPDKRSSDFKKKYGLENKTVILFVGRLALEKNLRSLASVYQRIKKDHPDIALLMVGEGPERDWITKLGLPDTVFTGALYDDELHHAYASADIFAFPSMSEAGPMVILEAMASGLPVVVLNTGGARDCIEDEETGYIAQDINEFEQRIEKLITNLELRNKMSNQARDYAKNRSWEGVLAKVFGSLDNWDQEKRFSKSGYKVTRTKR